MKTIILVTFLAAIFAGFVGYALGGMGAAALAKGIMAMFGMTACMILYMIRGAEEGRE